MKKIKTFNDGIKKEKQYVYFSNHAEDKRFCVKPNLYYKIKNKKGTKMNTKGKKKTTRQKS